MANLITFVRPYICYKTRQMSSKYRLNLRNFAPPPALVAADRGLCYDGLFPPFRRPPMLPWPPRDNPPVFTLNSASASRLVLLRALFHHAYATLPDWVWCLPLPQQSDEVLRAVARVARSYTRKGIERLAAK